LNKYKKQKEYISNKETELRNSENIIKHFATTRGEFKHSLDKSEAARKFLENNKAKFDEYISAKEQSDNLGKELQQFGNTKNYENLQKQQRDMEMNLTMLQGNKEKAVDKIETIEKQISTKQGDYEEVQKNLEAANARKKSKEDELKKITEQINTLNPIREEYNKLAKSYDIKKNEILELEKQKKELSNGICPILKAKCLAGDSTDYFEKRSRNLSEEQVEIEKKLEEKKQIPEHLEEKKTLLTVQQTDIKNIESQIDEYNKNLKKISYEIQVLMKEKQDCSGKLKKIDETANENNFKLKELKPEIEKAEKQKIQAEELRNKIDKIKCEKLDILRDVYDKYLENKSTAAEYERQKERLANIEKSIQKEMEKKEMLNKELSELNANFSEEQLRLKEDAVENLRKLKDETIEKVANLKSAIIAKNEEIKKFRETEKKIADLDSEIAIIRQKLELTADFRANIKDLGKIVAEERVRRIAVVASGYFNKITNRPESIRWVCSDSEKYSLYLGNGEEWHKFIDLSGGEQISVAIAIRLALSQAFGNSGLIILDEPTNNLDKNKRQLLSENLPKMVENLTQLFVVTHDDTFRNSATKVIEFNEEK
jgi:exonuclease SbcC